MKELLKWANTPSGIKNYEHRAGYEHAQFDVAQIVHRLMARPSTNEVQKAIEVLQNKNGFTNGMWYSAVNTVITALHQYKFPLVIQWTGKNLREVIDLVGLNQSAEKWTWEEYEQVVADKGLKIFTPTGSVMATVNDWIVYNGKDCYVLRQYQPVSEDVQQAIVRIRDHQRIHQIKEPYMSPLLDTAFDLIISCALLIHSNPDCGKCQNGTKPRNEILYNYEMPWTAKYCDQCGRTLPKVCE